VGKDLAGESEKRCEKMETEKRRLGERIGEAEILKDETGIEGKRFFVKAQT